MVKVETLNAEAGRSFLLTRELTPHMLQSSQSSLKTWYDTLPSEIRLENILKSETRFRQPGFHVHLLHLRGMMLCYGPIVAQLARNHKQHSKQSGASQELLHHREQAANAAIVSSRILRLLFDDQRMSKRCWLSMYE